MVRRPEEGRDDTAAHVKVLDIVKRVEEHRLPSTDDLRFLLGLPHRGAERVP